jgi:hypothetical protein
MTTENDDVSYLDVKPEDMIPIPPQEKVWAQIGDDLKLAFIDWDIITAMANEFDENHRQGQPKTQSQVMSKLLLLVREETRKERSNEA